MVNIQSKKLVKSAKSSPHSSVNRPGIILLISLVGLAGLVTLLFGYVNYNASQQLNRHATRTQGVVLSSRASQAKGGVSYTITYEFTSAQHSKYERTVNPPIHISAEKTPGNNISIVYNGSNPSQSYIDGTQPDSSGARLTILIGVGILTSCVIASLFLVHKKNRL